MLPKFKVATLNFRGLSRFKEASLFKMSPANRGVSHARLSVTRLKPRNWLKRAQGPEVEQAKADRERE